MTERGDGPPGPCSPRPRQRASLVPLSRGSMERLFDQPSTQNDAGTTQSPNASVHQRYTREFPSVARVMSQANEGATQSTDSLKVQMLSTDPEVTGTGSSNSSSSSISPVTVKEPQAEKQIQDGPSKGNSQDPIVVKARGGDGYFIYDPDRRYREAVKRVIEPSDEALSGSLDESYRLAQRLYDRCMDLEKELNDLSATQDLAPGPGTIKWQKQIGGCTVTALPPRAW